MRYRAKRFSYHTRTTVLTPDQLTDIALAFDSAFQRAPEPPKPVEEGLLVVKAGGLRYGLRCSQLHAVMRDKKITALPGSPSGVLGLAGFRGQLITVFSLAAQLGQPPEDSPRWLAIVTVSQNIRVALAFEALLRQVPIATQALLTDSSATLIESFWTDDGEEPLAVVSLPTLLHELQADGEYP